MRNLIIILSLLTYQLGSPALAENTLEKPNYITCVKTVETLDSFSRDILAMGCLTVVERYCMAPVRVETSCLDDEIQSIRDFIASAAPLLPPPPEDLTGFERFSYPRGLDRIRDGAQVHDVPPCKTYPKICILVAESAIVSDIFWLARMSNTSLP